MADSAAIQSGREEISDLEVLRQHILETRPAPLRTMEIKTVLKVVDFGAVSNDGKNDYAACVAALEAAKEAEGPVKIVFDPGVYHFASETVNPDKKDGALPMQGMENVLIEGNGAQVVITRSHMCFLAANGCANIIVRNFTVDYDPLPFTQGTVEALDADSASIVLELDKGFPDPSEEPFTSPKFAAFGMVRDPSGSGRMQPGKPDFYRIAKREKLSGRNVRLTLQEPKKLATLEKGDRFVLNCRAGAICSAFQSENVTMQNVTAYAVPDCFAVGADLSQLNLLNCKALLKKGRLMVSGADGIHIQAPRVGPWIEGCEFEGLSDDCLNLYNIPNYILEQSAPDRVKISFLERVREGDRLLFFNPREGKVIKIVTAKSVDESGVTLSESVDGLRLRPEDGRELGAPGGSYKDHGWKETDHIYNLNTCGNYFVFRDNYFHDGRRFGFFIKASNGLVENNRIERLSGVAFSVFNIPHHPEGFWTRNVIFSGNQIEDCGDDNYVLTIDMRGYYWPWNEFAGPFHQNLFFVNNSVSGSKLPLFKMNSVDGMTFSDNTFELNGRRVDAAEAIQQGASCKNIRFGD